MPTSTSHGRPYVEPERHDELSPGVAEQAPARDPRKPGGQLVQGARSVPSLGGKAHKDKTFLSHRIEGSTLDPVNVRRARTLRNRLSREIAAGVGGGVCGVAASLFLKFASQKTAAAEEAFAKGDFETHRRLSESARMDVLYAREHAAKQAQARPRMPFDPLATFMPKPEGAP
jgi:hypothetical protein